MSNDPGLSGSLVVRRSIASTSLAWLVNESLRVSSSKAMRTSRPRRSLVLQSRAAEAEIVSQGGLVFRGISSSIALISASSGSARNQLISAERKGNSICLFLGKPGPQLVRAAPIHLCLTQMVAYALGVLRNPGHGPAKPVAELSALTRAQVPPDHSSRNWRHGCHNAVTLAGAGSSPSRSR